MKLINFLKTIGLAIMVMVIATGCNKVSHNGAIDGNWQIQTIENTFTGDKAEPELTSYIAIQLHIMQLSNGRATLTANMVYDKKNATIECDFPYVKVNDIESRLTPYGIYSNPVTFKVVKADRGELVLRTDQTIITCRRF